MEAVLELIRETFGDFEIARDKICPLDSNFPLGFTATLISKNPIRALSSGTGSDWDIALRICVAEALERSIFLSLLKTQADAFFLKSHPTTCGFAAGFNREQSRFRAVCEGLERWAWSQWIDQQSRLERIEGSINGLSPIAKSLLNSFDGFQVYSRDIQVQPGVVTGDSLRFTVFLGLKGSGIYPGSRVSSHGDSWDHAIVEAHRNLLNAETFKSDPSLLEPQNFVGRRNLYFSQHAEEARARISSATKTDWSSPRLALLKEVDTRIPGAFVWRALFESFIPWHEGPDDRFVY